MKCQKSKPKFPVKFKPFKYSSVACPNNVIRNLIELMQKERQQHQWITQELQNILHEERTSYNAFQKELNVFLNNLNKSHKMEDNQSGLVIFIFDFSNQRICRYE